MTGSSSRIDVASPAGGYSVHVGRGLLARLGDLLGDATPAFRYAIIADDQVATLYGASVLSSLERAGLDGELFTFPAGERSKTRETWSDLTDRMLAVGIGRDAAVLGLGGGVSGDLAGFTASTYMRGLPYAAVPTSLLAMLDSSIGGKTGVDTPLAKNAVGTFHHPGLVVIDPDLLRTLPATERRAGLAEAVKAAAIRDAELFDWIDVNAARLREGDAAAEEELIDRSLRIKAEVVGDDPLEAGLRQILNFGHTAGHALETLGGFAHLHGEAVAAGMRIEARLGEAAGVTEPGTADRLGSVLDGCGIPDLLDAPAGPPGPAELLEAAANDKKGRRGHTRWVLLRSIGDVARDPSGSWTHALPGEKALPLLAAALRTPADVRDSAS